MFELWCPCHNFNMEFPVCDFLAGYWDLTTVYESVPFGLWGLSRFGRSQFLHSDPHTYAKKQKPVQILLCIFFPQWDQWGGHWVYGGVVSQHVISLFSQCASTAKTGVVHCNRFSDADTWAFGLKLPSPINMSHRRVIWWETTNSCWLLTRSGFTPLM